MPVRSQGF